MTGVDVVVPGSNYARDLERCVGTLLNQQGVRVRVLVIDDASEDDTAAVEEHRSRFARRCGTALSTLADLARELGRLTAVVEWRHRAVELSPFAASCPLGPGEALVEMGNSPGAVGALREYQERIRKEFGVEGEPQVERRVQALSGAFKP